MPIHNHPYTNSTGRIGVTFANFDNNENENRVTDGAFSLSRRSTTAAQGSQTQQGTQRTTLRFQENNSASLVY